MSELPPPGASLLYAYGVVPCSLDAAGAPRGVEEAAVSLVSHGPHAALVSELDPDSYTPDVIAARAGEVAWVAPRAAAHDRVLVWASDRAPVAPFPMWALFSGSDAIVAMLEQRSALLDAALARAAAGREYVVRVFARRDVIAANVATLSDSFAELERAAAGAPPGQAYLLRRKLDEARKREVRTVSARVADETHAALRSLASGVERSALPASDGSGDALLNAAFLVPNDDVVEFRAALTDLIGRYSACGFSFEFTGPWPAYHFARGAARAD